MGIDKVDVICIFDIRSSNVQDGNSEELLKTLIKEVF